MFQIVKNVLDAEALGRVLAQIDAAPFVDGRATAKGMAQSVKRNTQIDRDAFPELTRTLTRLVGEHPVVAALAMPKRITPVRIARYEPGMEYGYHSDNAVIDGVRTDLSFTLFLAEPQGYDGGELALQTPIGEAKIKPPAGHLVLYDTGAVHRVMPVTRGARLVAVGWVQSRIRDARQREIVIDLERMRSDYLARHGHDAHADLLLKTSTNLQRMWSEV